MKKILLTLLTASSLTMAEGFFQIGGAYAKGDDNANMGTSFVGITPFSNLGLRLEYTKNFSEHPEFSKDDVSRFGLFATYTLPIISSLSITPKAGLTKTDGEFTLKESVDKVTDSSTEFTYGLEVNYHYSEQISFFVGYTDYGKELDVGNIDTTKIDTRNYSVGIKIDI